MTYAKLNGPADYNNLNLQSKRKDIRDFKYDEKSEAVLGKRETRKAVILESGAKYDGEWIVGTQTRQGRGI
jgi:hypothetical protein